MLGLFVLLSTPNSPTRLFALFCCLILIRFLCLLFRFDSVFSHRFFSFIFYLFLLILELIYRLLDCVLPGFLLDVRTFLQTKRATPERKLIYYRSRQLNDVVINHDDSKRKKYQFSVADRFS